MNNDPQHGKERRRFFGLELWQTIAGGLIVTLTGAVLVAIVGHLLSGSSSTSTTGAPATTASAPTVTTSPQEAATSATTTTPPASSGSSSSCAITPSPVGEIYATPDPLAASGSVPVASYPVVKSEQVPFGEATMQWYEISVDGRLVWINDEPGQLTADSCGPP